MFLVIMSIYFISLNTNILLFLTKRAKTLVDERNKNLAVTKLLGVSISKKFIPSIANIVGTDLSNYKIVRTGQFAYGPVTSRNGEKISIAYLDEEDCIISTVVGILFAQKSKL